MRIVKKDKPNLKSLNKTWMENRLNFYMEIKFIAINACVKVFRQGTSSQDKFEIRNIIDEMIV